MRQLNASQDAVVVTIGMFDARTDSGDHIHATAVAVGTSKTSDSGSAQARSGGPTGEAGHQPPSIGLLMIMRIK